MSKSNEKTVLIVEKQPNYTQALVKQIIVAGLKPIIAVTGEGGLRKVEECHPDLVLVEAELSDMDGVTFVSEVKQNPWGDRIPIVAMSVFPQLRDRCLEAGCSDFLQKPIRMIELMTRLKKFAYLDPNPGMTKAVQHEAQPTASLPSDMQPEVSSEEISSPKPIEKDGESIHDLLVLSLATAEGLAKLLVEKGVITEKEYRDKISRERQRYQRIHQKIIKNRLKST